jgi:hypothetical protein
MLLLPVYVSRIYSLNLKQRLKTKDAAFHFGMFGAQKVYKKGVSEKKVM